MGIHLNYVPTFLYLHKDNRAAHITSVELYGDSPAVSGSLLWSVPSTYCPVCSGSTAARSPRKPWLFAGSEVILLSTSLIRNPSEEPQSPPPVSNGPRELFSRRDHPQNTLDRFSDGVFETVSLLTDASFSVWTLVATNGALTEKQHGLPPSSHPLAPSTALSTCMPRHRYEQVHTQNPVSPLPTILHAPPRSLVKELVKERNQGPHSGDPLRMLKTRRNFHISFSCRKAQTTAGFSGSGLLPPGAPRQGPNPLLFTL